MISGKSVFSSRRWVVVQVRPRSTFKDSTKHTVIQVLSWLTPSVEDRTCWGKTPKLGVLSSQSSHVWVSHRCLELASDFSPRQLESVDGKVVSRGAGVGAVTGTKPWSVALRMGSRSSYSAGSFLPSRSGLSATLSGPGIHWPAPRRN